jgi:hypothetical protein
MGEQTDRLLLEVEYTHRWYRDFLERLRADGYDIRDCTSPPGAGEVALRHDVGLSLEAALEMAQIEADVGVPSTFFVALSSPLYNALSAEGREYLRRIRGLGHTVSVLFRTGAYPELDRRPPTGAVESRVDAERQILSDVLDRTVPTVAFHDPPSWIRGESFEGFRSTYSPAFYESAAYHADTEQQWRREPPTVDRGDEPVQIVTHPGLWAERDADIDGRVEQAIVGSCRRTQQAARAEYLDRSDPPAETTTEREYV